MYDMATACDVILIRRLKIGMVTLRGDPAATTLQSAVRAVTGLDMPQPNRVTHDGEHAVCWMSPDECLLILPHDAVPQALDTIAAALVGEHHLAVDVSDARSVFDLEGRAAREVLSKLTPADLSPATFGPGDIRRTRLGQVAGAVWMTGESAMTVVCFRSFGAYLETLLKTSIAAGPVGFF